MRRNFAFFSLILIRIEGCENRSRWRQLVTRPVRIPNRDLIEKISFICSGSKKCSGARFLQFYLAQLR